MAKAKYIILFFLFLAAFLFIGESYSYFLENFQNSYTQVGYFLPTGENEQRFMSVVMLSKKDYKMIGTSKPEISTPFFLEQQHFILSRLKKRQRR